MSHKIEQIITCPVCAKEIPFSRINSHLDACSLGETKKRPASSTSSGGGGTGVAQNRITSFFHSNTSKKPKLDSSTQPIEIDLENEDGAEEVAKVVEEIPATVQNTNKYYEKIKHLPLSEKVRPKSLEDYVGQDHLLNKKDGILFKYIQKGKIPSMVLWGPPGVGKTTLARILVKSCNEMMDKMKGPTQHYKLVEISATKASVSDMKKIFENSRKNFQLLKQMTVLFIDEIHRFNKSQQDVLLPSLECGDITLIGCTTENPSFQINNALLSRCQVFVLKNLEDCDLEKVAQRGFHMMQKHYYPKIQIDEASEHDDFFKFLVSICNKDTRKLLNLLEMVIITSYSQEAEEKEEEEGDDDKTVLTRKLAEEILLKNNIQQIYSYDSKGDNHYDLISAFHKSIRGSKINESLFYLAKMLQGGEDPKYIARRMIRIASEDIGILNNSCLPFSVSTYEAVMKIGLPECELTLAHCCIMLCESLKSVKIYRTWNSIKQMVQDNEYDMGVASVPMHLRNAPTKLMSDLGYHKGYQYNPDFPNGVVDTQEYWPPEVLDKLKQQKNNGNKNSLDILNVYENTKHLGL